MEKMCYYPNADLPFYLEDSQPQFTVLYLAILISKPNFIMPQIFQGLSQYRILAISHYFDNLSVIIFSLEELYRFLEVDDSHQWLLITIWYQKEHLR